MTPPSGLSLCGMPLAGDGPVFLLPSPFSPRFPLCSSQIYKFLVTDLAGCSQLVSRASFRSRPPTRDPRRPSAKTATMASSENPPPAPTEDLESPSKYPSPTFSKWAMIWTTNPTTNEGQWMKHSGTPHDHQFDVSSPRPTLRSLRRATRMKKEIRRLQHKQSINHDNNKFEPSPDKTAAPSTDHHVELDSLTIPTSDHRIPSFDKIELPDHHFKSPLSNSLAPFPDHGVKFDFQTPINTSSQAKPHGLCNQTSTPIEKPKHQHGTNDFKPPDNTDHIKFEKFDLPVLWCELPLEPATTPADDHRIKFDNSELPDYHFEVPPEDSPAAVPSPDHGIELENFEMPPDKFALSPMGANATPPADHLGEFDLQFKLADTIAHWRQTHERLLSYFQHRHKKKQWTMPTLAKPQSPTKNSEKPGPSLHTA